jgi:hypothetical protein
MWHVYSIPAIGRCQTRRLQKVQRTLGPILKKITFYDRKYAKIVVAFLMQIVVI